MPRQCRLGSIHPYPIRSRDPRGSRRTTVSARHDSGTRPATLVRLAQHDSQIGDLAFAGARPFYLTRRFRLELMRSKVIVDDMRALRVVLVLAFIPLAGCGPKQPEAPATPQKSVAEERREKWFGVELAHKPGIAWRDSGLGIEVLVPGDGTAPTRTDRVRVNYVGRLIDGTEFDSSYQRGKPNDFLVQHLITGWAAAMPALKPGGKGIFYIPPHLGYGGLKAGNIPPNSALIFEVELLAVNP
ncbi:MAG: hypothetical protein C0518_09310 [Opitutus sp.]|nr:hypothetical protein [Opitutus sp.]